MTSTSAKEESMRDYRTLRPGTYEEMTWGFRWEGPASYNLAADVLDKHEPDRPAMRFVSDEGRDERWTFGDVRRLTDRTANTLRGLGVGKGDRVAVMAPASPEIAASFLATYKVEAILLSMSVLYGDDAIVYRLNDAEAKVLITSAAHRDRVAALLGKAPSVEHLVVVGGAGALNRGGVEAAVGVGGGRQHGHAGARVGEAHADAGQDVRRDRRRGRQVRALRAQPHQQRDARDADQHDGRAEAQGGLVRDPFAQSRGGLAR